MTGPAALTVDSSNDAELLAAGMLMRRDGFLDRVDVRELSWEAGKPLGELDVEARVRRLLAVYGYRQHTVSVEPVLAVPKTFDEWVAYLQQSRPPFDADTIDDLRVQHADLIVWQQALIGLRADFPGQFSHDQRPYLTVADADALLDDGWAITVELEGGPGWTVYGMAFYRTGSGYRVFHPLHGWLTTGRSVFAGPDGVIRELYAWRHPKAVPS